MALPSNAAAGGFSTVSLDVPPPDGIGSGDAWDVRFTVLAHGRTPLPGLRPEVRIEAADGKSARTFPARTTARPGTYRARVRFPADGLWQIEVVEHRGMDAVPGHRFGEVRVGSSPGPPDAVAAVTLGLLAGALAWLARLGSATRWRAAPAATDLRDVGVER